MTKPRVEHDTDSDPAWGPWGKPKPKPVTRYVRDCLAYVSALGRSPSDPSRGFAVLAYHGTEPDSRHPWWLDFKAHMSLIEDLGYRVVTLGEVIEGLASALPPSAPTLAITFDDGWASNLAVAFPELARRGWPSTVFITTAFLGRRPFLQESDLPGLRELGVEIGNHTHRHDDITTLADQALLDDLDHCSRRLFDLTGQRPRAFCYPFGRYDPRVRRLVASTDMVAACSGRVGFNPPGRDPFVLRRLTLDPRDRRWNLKARLAGGYDFLDFRQRHMDRA